MQNNTTIERLKGKQLEYFDRMLAGNYDMDYLMSRLEVGWRHTELGIVPLWYIGAYGKYLDELKRLVEENSEEPEEVFESLFKVMLLDMTVTLEAYHYGKYRLQEELKQAVVTDELTGVFNRRKFDEVVGFEMERSPPPKDAPDHAHAGHRPLQAWSTITLAIRQGTRCCTTWPR